MVNCLYSWLTSSSRTIPAQNHIVRTTSKHNRWLNFCVGCVSDFRTRFPLLVNFSMTMLHVIAQRRCTGSVRQRRLAVFTYRRLLFTLIEMRPNIGSFSYFNFVGLCWPDAGSFLAIMHYCTRHSTAIQWRLGLVVTWCATTRPKTVLERVS